MNRICTSEKNSAIRINKFDYSSDYSEILSEKKRRFRKDVWFKAILRNFKKYFINDFIEKTGFNRGNKNSSSRREQLKKFSMVYAEMKGYLEVSRELPFYLGMSLKIIIIIIMV